MKAFPQSLCSPVCHTKVFRNHIKDQLLSQRHEQIFKKMAICSQYFFKKIFSVDISDPSLFHPL